MKPKHYLTIIILLIAIGGLYIFFQQQEKQNLEARIEMQRQQELSERRQARINHLNEIIPSIQAKLQMEINKLDGINEFQFLRTPDEKEAQLAEQYKIINGIKENLRALQEELSSLNIQQANAFK